MSKTYKIPNDYNIYSALSTGKVSDSVLTSLFLKRGIILSSKTSRESKAHYFSSFMHSYSDFEVISAQHSKVGRAEYTSSTNVNTQLKIPDIIPIMSDIKSELEDKLANIQLKNVIPDLKNNVLSLKFDYEVFYPEKQMFAQIENKEAVLTFKKDETNDQFYLEHPATPEMINWTGSILNVLKVHDKDMDIDNIDLTGLTDPKLYWQFFDQLTKSFETFERTNVVEILLKNPNTDDNDEDDSAYKLISASYRGNQLHLASDFITKIEEGYRLYKFTWDCIDSSETISPKYRLSIKVTYDSNGKNNFSFISKGFFKNKEGSFSKTLNALSDILDNKFNKLIFKHGMNLINILLDPPLKISLEDSNNNSDKNVIDQGG